MYVDNSKKPFTAVEWCAGYAGIHLGLQRVIPNLRVIAFSEIEAFACANLVAKMEAGLLEPAPIWTNLKTFPSQEFAGKVDLLVAGYNCQPFSHAGKRRGAEDERHLWPYISDGIRAMRPRFCFFENVEGHITLGLSTVISDLAEMGYKTTWGIFSASEVGAPHQRKRVFILAYNGCSTSSKSQQPTELRPTGTSEPSSNSRLQSGGCEGKIREVWPSRPGQPQYEWEPPRVVENTIHERNRRRTSIARGDVSGGANCEVAVSGGGSKDRFPKSSPIKPPLGRDFNESADRLDDAELYESCDNRVDELRLLGNGVVPATAARAWEVLYARLLGITTKF